MSRRTKKQPYRNALLKLKKERASLNILYKENQCLNASALYKQKEAQSLLQSAAEDKEQIEILRNEMLKELKQYNPYHPSLHTNVDVTNVTIDDALRYRISAPSVNWDDTQKCGMVSINCHKQPNKQETVVFGFSEALVKDCERYISEDMIDIISKQIATDLMETATTKMKEW